MPDDERDTSRIWNYGDGNPLWKGISQEEIAERNRAILDMVAAGKHPKQIARITGLGETTIYDIVRHRKQEITSPAAEVVRAQELERLEYLRATQVQPVLEAHHPVLYQGDVVPGVEDVGPKLTAVQTDLKISEQIRKITGADVPVRHEVGGRVEFTLIGVDPDDVR